MKSRGYKHDFKVKEKVRRTDYNKIWILDVSIEL